MDIQYELLSKVFLLHKTFFIVVILSFKFSMFSESSK